MYKVQLRLKIYRELQKVMSGGSLCETLGWLNHTVERFTDDLLCGAVRTHNTNAASNTAHLMKREVKQQALREFKVLMANVTGQSRQKD